MILNILVGVNNMESVNYQALIILAQDRCNDSERRLSQGELIN